MYMDFLNKHPYDYHNRGKYFYYIDFLSKNLTIFILYMTSQHSLFLIFINSIPLLPMLHSLLILWLCLT